jgi:hypothetical protein
MVAARVHTVKIPELRLVRLIIKWLQRSKNAPRRDMFEDKKKKQGKR